MLAWTRALFNFTILVILVYIGAKPLTKDRSKSTILISVLFIGFAANIMIESGAFIYTVFSGKFADPTVYFVGNIIRGIPIISLVALSFEPVVLFINYKLITRLGGAPLELVKIDSLISTLNQSEEQIVEKLRREKEILEKANEELIRSEARAIEAAEILKIRRTQLENHLHAINHDLRTPIVTIRNMADKLTSESDPDKITKFIGFISGAATAADHVVSGMSEYSKFIQKQQNFQRSQTNIKVIVDNVIKSLESDIIKSKVTVNNTIAECTQIYCSPLISQIFQNMIANSIRYRNTTLENSFVEISVDEETDYEIIFLVEDNGIGFDQENEDLIYQIFRSIADKPHKDGSGLGMTIALEIAQAHGGEIWAKSKGDNCGSQFRFSIRKEYLDRGRQ